MKVDPHQAFDDPALLYRWVGRAMVRPRRGCHMCRHIKRAAVCVAGDAINKDDFHKLVKTVFARYGLDVLRLDDVDLLQLRLQTRALPEDLMHEVASICPQRPLALGAFEGLL